MIPAKSRFVAHRIIEGEGFVVDTRVQVLHHLNPVGAVIWKNIDGKNSEEQLAAFLCREFEVDSDTALSDVKRFLGELREKSLIDEVKK